MILLPYGGNVRTTGVIVSVHMDKGLVMEQERDPKVINSRDFHALHAHLSVAIPVAEQLCARFPDDRVMQRLCIYLYDALDLMVREPLDEEYLYPELLDAGRSTVG